MIPGIGVNPPYSHGGTAPAIRRHSLSSVIAIASSLTLLAMTKRKRDLFLAVTPLLPSLRVATKQSSVLLFQEAFPRICWIATSHTLLAMTREHGLFLVTSPLSPSPTLFSRHCERQRSNPASSFSLRHALPFPEAPLDRFVVYAPRHGESEARPFPRHQLSFSVTGPLPSSLRVAAKQSSVLLFEKAFPRICWIASSLMLLAMTRGARPFPRRHPSSPVIASGNEAIQRPPFSRSLSTYLLDCFVAYAPRNDESESVVFFRHRPSSSVTSFLPSSLRLLRRLRSSQ
jgi:hypothetical protein